MHMYLTKLIEKYPTKTIVFLTPNTHVTSKNTNGETMEQFTEAMKLACRKYSIPCLDLFALCGIYPDSEAQKEYFMPDSLHPSDTGNFRMAKIVAGYLNSLSI